MRPRRLAGVDPPGVLVVDAEPLFAEGVRSLLAAAGMSVQVGAELPTGPGRDDATVLVADSGLLGGLIQVRRLLRDRPVVVLVLRRIPPAGVSALLDAGVPVVVHRACTREELLSAVRAGAAGRSWLSAPMAQVVRSEVRAGAAGAPAPALSARELEVLAQVASGATNAGIAETLGLSPNTVRNHVRAVMLKFEAGTRTEAVAIAARRGLVDL